MQRSGSIERAAALVYRPKDWDKKPEEPTGAVAFDPSLYAGRNIHSYSPSSMGRVALPGAGRNARAADDEEESMPSPPRRAETAGSLADANPTSAARTASAPARCRAAPATQATPSSAAAAPAPAPPPPPDDPTPPPPPDDAPPPPPPPPPGDRASAARKSAGAAAPPAPDAGASVAEVRRLADVVASLQRGHEALARQMAELTAQRDAQRVRADALEEQLRRLAASVDRLRSPPPPPPPPSAGATRALPHASQPPAPVAAAPSPVAAVPAPAAAAPAPADAPPPSPRGSAAPRRRGSVAQGLRARLAIFARADEVKL